MSSSLPAFVSRRLAWGACLLAAAACGESSPGRLGDGLGDGDELRKAGERAAQGAEDAGQAAAEGAQDAGVVLGEQLEEASEALEDAASDLSSAVNAKGDQLAATLKSKLPALQGVRDTVKSQLIAAGGALEELGHDIDTKFEALDDRLAQLSDQGAGAAEELKQAAVQAFAELSAELKAAIARLRD